MPAGGGHRRGAVLILVVGMIAILATMATVFLSRSRGTSAVGEDAIRLAQTRIMLNAALSYIRESSRLGYALVEGGGDPAAGDLLLDEAREAWGWIDTRTIVPGSGTRIGPNAGDGSPLWSPGSWPAPGGVVRAPMYRMRRPPFVISQDYVRNAIPTDLTKPTFGLPFLANPDPLPGLPAGSYFDLDDPTVDGGTGSTVSPSAPVVAVDGSAARKVWAEGDRTPATGSADLGWFRVYRERIAVDASGTLRSTEPAAQLVPAGAGACTFIVTVGAGGSRGFRDWAEVAAHGNRASFGNDRQLFEELVGREQRQWFRVGWSAAVGGGEDLIVKPAISHGAFGPQRSHYEGLPLNTSRWRGNHLMSPSQPRNYGGTISFIQRLDEPPVAW